MPPLSHTHTEKQPEKFALVHQKIIIFLMVWCIENYCKFVWMLQPKKDSSSYLSSCQINGRAAVCTIHKELSIARLDNLAILYRFLLTYFICIEVLHFYCVFKESITLTFFWIRLKDVKRIINFL